MSNIMQWIELAAAEVTEQVADPTPAFCFEGEPAPPSKTTKVNGGVQALYHFPNGYGASVVRHSFSYGGEAGLWELAVIHGASDDWNLTYDTPITDDVLGHLTDADVARVLRDVYALPAVAA